MELRLNEYSSNNAQSHYKTTGLSVKINTDFLTCMSTDEDDLVDNFMQSKDEDDFIKRINLECGLSLIGRYDYRGDLLTEEEVSERREEFLDTLTDCALECYHDISRADDETNEWFEYVQKYKEKSPQSGEINSTNRTTGSSL